jgi:hypothetical protein
MTMADHDDDMQSEYDFAAMAGGERGKYYARFQKGTNLVRLDPDVQRYFPNSESVNFALRQLAQVMDHSKATG